MNNEVVVADNVAHIGVKLSLDGESPAEANKRAEASITLSDKPFIEYILSTFYKRAMQ